MMKIEPATKADIFTVAMGMRQSDFDEFSAVSFAEDRPQLATVLAERYGDNPDVLCGWYGARQACIGGLIMSRPNVVTLLFFGTDNFRRIGLGITRWIRRELFPRYEAAGVHRFEAVSMATHNEAHVWLKTLGLEPETGPLAGYGRRGEAFIQFSRVRDVGPAGS